MKRNPSSTLSQNSISNSFVKVALQRQLCLPVKQVSPSREYACPENRINFEECNVLKNAIDIILNLAWLHSSNL